MARFTTQQQQALEVRDTSVVLSAGAGCGKTTVLTERFVSALDIENNVPLHRIVALTFTDKAAGELRNRVRLACRAKLDEGEDPDYWRAVLRGLEAAPIGTFHTFCGEIVRQYAVSIGVDPGFTILDESIASTYRELAVDATLRRALNEGDLNLRELAVEYGLNSVRDTLINLMSDRLAPELKVWATWTPLQLQTLWQKSFATKVIPAVLHRLHRDLQPCIELLETYECRFHPKMRERRQFLLDNIPELLDSTDPVSLIKSINENAKIAGVVAAKWPSPELYSLFAATFETARDTHIKDALASLKYDDANTLVSAAHGIRFAQLGSIAWREFENFKQRRGALDFNDLLLKARDLLLDDSLSARADLIRRYDLILVDEFQDTDPIQDEIIRMLGGDAYAKGRLFLVGDFKQSIYGFRGARPELFSNYRDEFPKAGQLPLTENFRSRPAVLNVVNALFSEAFSEPYVQLTPGRPDVLEPEQTSVVLAWPEPISDLEAKDKRLVEQKREEEATRLAQIILKLINQRFPVRDPVTAQSRPIQPGDVAILFRKNSGFLPFEKALAAVGLDYHVIGGSAYYAQQEVQDLIHVLTILDDPHNSLALAGALRSPFFALSDEALFWLTTVGSGELAEGLAQCDELTLPDLSASDRKHAQRAHHYLGRWRSFKDREPIGTLVLRVIEESGFEAALLGEPLGARKRANARKLVRIARKFDVAGGFTLADFVARLRDDMNSPPKEEQAGTTEERGDAVRLLTIHKAKGLEFPVVFLPDLDSKPGSQTRLLILDEALGPLVNAKADSEGDDEPRTKDAPGLGRLVHKLISYEENRAEDIRVFYVATTRTRDLLVLSSCGDPTGKPQTAAMELLRKRFDVLTGTCLATLSEKWPSPEIQVVFGIPSTDLRVDSHERRRPPVRAIARLIERSPAPVPITASEHRFPLHLPTYLNLNPSSYLSPSSARLDQLVRAMALDPRSLRAETRDEAATDCARRQHPAAPHRMTSEALDRIRPWLLGPMVHEISRATEVVRDIAWTVSKRFSESEEIVISGRIDMAYRDSSGVWRLVQFGDCASFQAAQRLCLTLSASVATGLGCGPIQQSWFFFHGAGGGLESIAATDELTPDMVFAVIDELGASR